MKNYLLFFSLCFFAIQAKSQSTNMADMFPKGATYYIKGGDEIPYSKVDSIVASWGGKFNMQHDDGNKITIWKPTEDDAKATEALMAKTAALLNQPAKDFTLTDINGKTYTLASLRGKTVVLNFWFTTCPGCISEMPELNKIKNSYAGKNVVFLGLALDGAPQIKGFLKNHTFDYNLLAEASKVATAYNISLFPTSMVINKDGIISFVLVSSDNVAGMLTTAINAAL